MSAETDYANIQDPFQMEGGGIGIIPSQKSYTITSPKIPNKDFWADFQKRMELDQRYARIKEVARRVCKLWTTNPDSEEFAESISDLIEEL